MKPMLLFLLLGLARGLETDEPIEVSSLLDEAFQELSKRILVREDVTEALDKGNIGDYLVQGGRLADLTSLKRVGPAWMWNEYRTILVNSTLSLGTMFLANANISGPRNIQDAIITVSKNLLNFYMNITLNAKSHCTAVYSFKWTLIDGVTLYPGNPHMNNINLSSWVKRNMESVNDLLESPLRRLFEANIHMCQSKWLNKLELLKYEALIKTELMNETFK